MKLQKILKNVLIPASLHYAQKHSTRCFKGVCQKDSSSICKMVCKQVLDYLKKKCTVSEDWSFKYGRNLTLSNNCQNKENYKCQP